MKCHCPLAFDSLHTDPRIIISILEFFNVKCISLTEIGHIKWPLTTGEDPIFLHVGIIPIPFGIEKIQGNVKSFIKLVDLYLKSFI